MFFVYVIRSVHRNYTYVGLSSQLEERLKQHNRGYNRTTKPYAPFKLIWKEPYETRIEAREREKYLKSGIGRGIYQNPDLNAQVAELVDALDSKSSGSNIVPVRSRPWVLIESHLVDSRWLFLCSILMR